MIVKKIGLPSGSTVVLHFSCGSCIKGHRASKCAHYEEFTANFEQADPSKNFYFVKPRGKKPSRTVALLMLQVAPTEYNLSPDWENCPRCPTFPDAYSFQCRKNCCVETGVFVVDPYIPLQLCHTELDMRVLPGEDAIPYCGSEEAREAYRTWNYISNGGKSLEELQKLQDIDTKASFGQGIATRVMKKYNFDAYQFTSGMTKKTMTGFYKKAKVSKDNNAPKKTKSECHQSSIKSSSKRAQRVTRKALEINIHHRRRRAPFNIAQNSLNYTNLHISRPFFRSYEDPNIESDLDVIRPPARSLLRRIGARYLKASKPMWICKSGPAADDEKGIFDSDTYTSVGDQSEMLENSLYDEDIYDGDTCCETDGDSESVNGGDNNNGSKIDSDKEESSEYDTGYNITHNNNGEEEKDYQEKHGHTDDFLASSHLRHNTEVQQYRHANLIVDGFRNMKLQHKSWESETNYGQIIVNQLDGERKRMSFKVHQNLDNFLPEPLRCIQVNANISKEDIDLIQ